MSADSREHIYIFNELTFKLHFNIIKYNTWTIEEDCYMLVY